MKLDQTVKDLAQGMSRMFLWAHEAKDLKNKIGALSETIEKMAEQTMSCAEFIKEYTKRGFLGTSSAFPDSLRSSLMPFLFSSQKQAECCARMMLRRLRSSNKALQPF